MGEHYEYKTSNERTFIINESGILKKMHHYDKKPKKVGKRAVYLPEKVVRKILRANQKGQKVSYESAFERKDYDQPGGSLLIEDSKRGFYLTKSIKSREPAFVNPSDSFNEILDEVLGSEIRKETISDSDLEDTVDE